MFALCSACGRSGFWTDSVLHDACGSAVPNSYAVLASAQPVVLDGDTAEHERACPLTVDSSTGAHGSYRLTWDSEALHVAADVVDPQLDAFAPEDGTDLYKDDSVEIMFDTDRDGGDEMHLDDYKFIVNLRNIRYDHRGVSWRDPPWDSQFMSAALAHGTVNDDSDDDFGYTIELSIAWAAWGITRPTDGAVWGFDLLLNDRHADEEVVQSAWANPQGSTRTNVPDLWGSLMFVQSP